MQNSISIDLLNSANAELAASLLDGVYEHSPWIASQAIQMRPFKSLAHLKHVLSQVVSQAKHEAQLALICAHPELAGKAMVSQSLTAESTNEQSQAGLTHCSPEQFARLQTLNKQYNEKFGWPFILAVRGPRGTGFSRQQIIQTFERRLNGLADFEFSECLRNIHRIAEIRLNDKFSMQLSVANELWDWHEQLARYSDHGFKERGELTVTFMTDAHKQVAQEIAQRMRSCGFDTVEIDVLGNVVGRYAPLQSDQPYILTGSHYDTVRNGGKYDGRLGFFLPMMCVQQLSQAKKRLEIGIEVVAFSEEEGQRYKATFLSSGALTGHFNPGWLDQADCQGITMLAALNHGKSESKTTVQMLEAISKLKRDAKLYNGFVEIHIEQGPVLNELNLPLGVVTSINGGVRYLGSITGQACHAGTTPMNRRRDAVAALAQLSVFIEQRATLDGDSVATIGILNVPNGSINVVPGRCDFSLDCRAPNDAQRDKMLDDIKQGLASICKQRGVSFELEETMRAAAAPSNPKWQARWEQAVASTGLPVYKMPSGAGHDAMKLHEVMPQAMLFVRGENSGISHNPLESTTNDDMQLAIDAFNHLIHTI